MKNPSADADRTPNLHLAGRRSDRVDDVPNDPRLKSTDERFAVFSVRSIQSHGLPLCRYDESLGFSKWQKQHQEDRSWRYRGRDREVENNSLLISLTSSRKPENGIVVFDLLEIPSNYYQLDNGLRLQRTDDGDFIIDNVQYTLDELQAIATKQDGDEWSPPHHSDTLSHPLEEAENSRRRWKTEEVGCDARCHQLRGSTGRCQEIDTIRQDWRGVIERSDTFRGIYLSRSASSDLLHPHHIRSLS